MMKKLLSGLLSALILFPAIALAQSRPTVIFEAGLGDDHRVWHSVIERLDGTATFAYDRPGYGGTPASKSPRDPCTIASELHERLRASGIRPPYLLVGHSLGGQYAYAFARLYPEEMAGLVLLDATPIGHWQALQRQLPEQADTLRVIRLFAFSRTMRREFDSQDQCLSSLSRGPMTFPVHVLVRTQVESDDDRRLMDVDYKLAQRWLDMSGATHLERVQGAGHYIQKDRPDHLEGILRDMMVQTERPH